MWKLILCVLLLNVGGDIVAQERHWLVATYNVENLFDPRVEPRNPDSSFTPRGTYHWTFSRLNRKVHLLAQALYALAGPMPFAFVGLCEVENRYVLRRLADSSILSSQRLAILHRDSPDPRGIDVALLYQPRVARLLDTQWIHPPWDSVEGPPTREMLHATFRLVDGDTLHVVQCHWPSKRNNDAATRRKRQLVVHSLARVLDSVRQHSPEARIIVMGDFNEQLQAAVFDTIVDREVGVLPSRWQKLRAMQLDPAFNRRAPATYKYRGAWGSIDHVLVSAPLLDTSSACHVISGSMRIAQAAFLLEDDVAFGGVKPRRTYTGPAYRGGVSDHLPVGVILRFSMGSGMCWE